MLELRPVDFSQIQSFFVDFQKKSKCFEMPLDNTYLAGIFVDNEMVGYFITCGYTDGTLEIQQGYLKPMARHKRLSYMSMEELQKQAKNLGFKSITLKASRSLKAYTKFMADLGFKPESVIFSKVI